MILWFLACRGDPGLPDYPERDAWTLQGDDFYVDEMATGEERLGIGVFYEGETSEWVPIDDVSAHFYIYENTFTMTTTDRRYEGYTADVLTRGSLNWWGGGVHWDVPKDLSAYDVLNLVVRSSDTDQWEVGLTGGGQERRVKVSDFGAVADGEWHRMRIPLSEFAGADLHLVTVPLLLVGEAGTAGDLLVVDDCYFSRGGL